MATNPTQTSQVNKVMPAPGASPQGGTTSLPQMLQSMMPPSSPGIGGGMPGAKVPGGANLSNPAGPGAAPGSGAMPGGTGPMAPPPASTPPGTVPPPPPVAPPVAPTPPAAAPPDKNQVMGNDLYDELLKMFHNPSRYDEAGARTTGMHALQDEQTIARDRATADAANRGVFYGSPLTNSYGNIDDRFLRETGDLESKIAQDKASNFQNDRTSALDAIFKYGGMQQLDKQHQDDLWLELLKAGYIGGPDVNSLVSGLQPPKVG